MLLAAAIVLGSWIGARLAAYADAAHDRAQAEWLVTARRKAIAQEQGKRDPDRAGDYSIAGAIIVAAVIVGLAHAGKKRGAMG